MKIKKIGVNRRSFIKLLSALGIATASKPDILAQAPSPSPSPSPTPAPRVTKEMLRQTEKLIGIELTDAQEAMALSGVNRNLDSYETVRKIDIPLDTEPAIAFHPMRAKMVYGPRTKFRLGKVEPLQFKTVEDLAFVVTSLFMGLELTTSLEEDESRADGVFRTIGLMASLLEGLLAQAQPEVRAQPEPQATRDRGGKGRKRG